MSSVGRENMTGADAGAAPVSARNRHQPPTPHSEVLNRIGSGVRSAAGVIAPWAGLAHLCLILGGSVAMQFVGADGYEVPDGVWLQRAPESWLRLSAASGAVAAIVALLGGRVGKAALAFGALFTVWMGSGALSSWVLAGQPDMRSLFLGVACGGLALGAAAARPAWSGWALYLVGLSYIWLNLVALYKNYYSLGTEFTVAGRWWLGLDAPWPQYVGKVRELPVGLPYPEGHWGRVIALPRFLWESDAWAGVIPWSSSDPSYLFRGLTGNGNRGGNFVAPLVAFAVPFARRRFRRYRDGHRGAVSVAQAGLAIAVVGPGLLLLFAMGARAAFVASALGVLVGLLPVGRLRGRKIALGAAVAAPGLVLLPWLVALLGGPSLSGRGCFWESWASALRASSIVWGGGPPGTFPAACSGQEGGELVASHAHNELLQAWGVGGLAGFAAAMASLALLGWYAARYPSSDAGALAATLTTAAILMGVEVLSSTFGNHVHLGIGAFGAVAGRSLALMPQGGTRGPTHRTTGGAAAT